MAAKSEAGEKLIAEREAFNRAGGTAEVLAVGLGLASRAPEGKPKRSKRFSYFDDEERFAIIAGAQERRDTDLALAHGLSQCEDKKLTLVLPRDHAFATLQRSAWLIPDAQPDIWVHDGAVAQKVNVPTPKESCASLRTFVATRPDKRPDAEFQTATTPVYLGKSAPGIAVLVEWATEHPKLDGSHRQGERAWHCMGQKVLSIQGTPSRGYKIRAGIHWGEDKDKEKPKKNPPYEARPGEDLDDEAQSVLRDRVNEGIEARLNGHPDLHAANDEHWLQAILRRRPEIVGVEQPALREVPAWRPLGAEPSGDFKRGFIDLVGLDGHGDTRIVETKLTSNVDELLVFQGLDYFIWAQVYGAALRTRLGAPAESDFVVHYVLGADPKNKTHESPYLRAQVDALHHDIEWRFQIVTNWFNPTDPWSEQEVHSQLLPVGTLPSEVSQP